MVRSGTCNSVRNVLHENTSCTLNAYRYPWLNVAIRINCKTFSIAQIGVGEDLDLVGSGKLVPDPTFRTQKFS
jgi:hypothetical protein